MSASDDLVFVGSPKPTLGVEVELQIIDPETLNLTNGAPRILEALDGDDHYKPELIESTIEVNTDVCANVTEVRADLEKRFEKLHAVVDKLGYRLSGTGTHPFATWPDQRITEDERYYRLVDRCQWPARRLLIFGLHVHVGVSSGEKAIAIHNALSTYLPHLLALSASSPFWDGEDTGLASVRTKVFETLPTAGIPYRLVNWGEFRRLMRTLIQAEAIKSIREIWWDIRPHPGFGTVEIRVCDGVPTLSELMSVVAFIQALVVRIEELYDQGLPVSMPRAWIVRENKWRASRWAENADIVLDDDGNCARLKDEIVELVERLSPVAKRLGSLEELGRVPGMMDRGLSHVRQRRVFADTGDFKAVVDALATEFRTDVPCLG